MFSVTFSINLLISVSATVRAESSRAFQSVLTRLLIQHRFRLG
jgi:hypothetical protein